MGWIRGPGRAGNQSSRERSFGVARWETHENLYYDEIIYPMHSGGWRGINVGIVVGIYAIQGVYGCCLQTRCIVYIYIVVYMYFPCLSYVMWINVTSLVQLPRWQTLVKHLDERSWLWYLPWETSQPKRYWFLVAEKRVNLSTWNKTPADLHQGSQMEVAHVHTCSH